MRKLLGGFTCLSSVKPCGTVGPVCFCTRQEQRDRARGIIRIRQIILFAFVYKFIDRHWRNNRLFIIHFFISSFPFLPHDEKTNSPTSSPAGNERTQYACSTLPSLCKAYQAPAAAITQINDSGLHFNRRSRINEGCRHPYPIRI